MAHQFKTFDMKADETGKIAGFFSTYDKEPDSYGDIIEPGAFTDTLAKRAETGHPFPLCWNHDFSEVIGACDSIEDTEKGPYVEAHFLDTQKAQDVRKAVQSGAVWQYSFAYDVLDRRDPTAEEKAAGITNVLTKVDLFEVSVVTVPANQNAVVTEVKAGRRNRKADEEVIKNCIESLKSLLDDGEEDNPAEAEAPEKAAPEVNEASKELTDSGNSKRAEDILAKINELKED